MVQENLIGLEEIDDIEDLDDVTAYWQTVLNKQTKYINNDAVNLFIDVTRDTREQQTTDNCIQSLPPRQI